jgi:hypothetical protein
MNQKILNLSKSLSLLGNEGWIIESDFNKIWLWHPEKAIFELVINSLITFGWRLFENEEEKSLVFYL